MRPHRRMSGASPRCTATPLSTCTIEFLSPGVPPMPPLLALLQVCSTAGVILMDHGSLQGVEHVLSPSIHCLGCAPPRTAPVIVALRPLSQSVRAVLMRTPGLWTTRTQVSCCRGASGWTPSPATWQGRHAAAGAVGGCVWRFGPCVFRRYCRFRVRPSVGHRAGGNRGFASPPRKGHRQPQEHVPGSACGHQREEAPWQPCLPWLPCLAAPRPVPRPTPHPRHE